MVTARYEIVTRQRATVTTTAPVPSEELPHSRQWPRASAVTVVPPL